MGKEKFGYNGENKRFQNNSYEELNSSNNYNGENPYNYDNQDYNSYNDCPQDNYGMNDGMYQNGNTKFCKYCGCKIPFEAIICTQCGCQVEELKGNNYDPNVVINNNNFSNNYSSANSYNNGYMYGRRKNKFIALFLLIFFGFIGAHKFYEGKTGMGILYIFTMGLFGLGLIVDFISLITKPTMYYV